MSFYPFLSAGSLQQLATTGAVGFALQNATPTLLTWTAPADGQLHRVVAILNGYVTSGETGGAVNLTTVLPDGQAANPQLLAGGAAIGALAASALRIVGSGSVVTVAQTSALTAGAATVWVELWGS